MKINKKNKKIIVVGLIVLGLGTLINFGYGQINDTQNAHVSVESYMNFIEEKMGERNKLVVDMKANINKYDEGKKAVELVENEYKKSQDIEDRNDRIKVYSEVNKQVDALIDIYDKNEGMKKDKELSERVEELANLDYMIDDCIIKFNKDDVERYNRSISKFPVRMIAKIKGWNVIDKF